MNQESVFKSENQKWQESNFKIIFFAAGIVNLAFFLFRVLRGQDFGVGMLSSSIYLSLAFATWVYGVKSGKTGFAAVFSAGILLVHLCVLIFFGGPSYLGSICWLIALPILSNQTMTQRQAALVMLAVAACSLVYMIFPPQIDPAYFNLRRLNVLGLVIICPTLLLYIELNRRKAFERIKAAVSELRMNQDSMLEEGRITQVLKVNSSVHSAIAKDLAKVQMKIGSVLQDNPNDKDLIRVINSIKRIQETLKLARDLETKDIQLTEYSQGELMVDLKRNHG